MIKDYQQVSKNILKSKLPFPLRDQRVITYTKTNIGVQNVYSAEPDFVTSLLKKGQRYQSMDGAPEKAFVNKVKKEKKADVKKLMAFFVVPDDSVEFYASIMDAEEVIADDEVYVFDENETFHWRV